MATKVTLRKKRISKERESLYLDFYPAIPHPETGEPTRREFIGLYIYEPIKFKKRKNNKGEVIETSIYNNDVSINQTWEKHNTETLQIAESIRQKRENYLNKPEIYDQYEKEQLRLKELGEQCFVEYFKKLAYKREASNHGNWMSALNYLEDFTGGNVKFADLNEKYLEDFKDYLLTTKSKKSSKTTLAQNSAVSYFNKVKAALKQAYKDDILQKDLNAKIKPIETAETRREYLTIVELNNLIKTPCNNQILKRAALFSALTGMAFKEIQNMIWKDITFTPNKGYLVLSKRQKTQTDNYLPIPDQAYDLCGKPGEPTASVFDGLDYSAYHNKHLFQWIGAAGITKDITFHCFRHTYATLQLESGTDIFTISKMLGHKDLKTTQIYAKIVDETKRKATDKIKLDFSPLKN